MGHAEHTVKLTETGCSKVMISNALSVEDRDQSRTVSLIMAEFLFEERLVCTIGLALQQVFFLCTIDVPNQL